MTTEEKLKEMLGDYYEMGVPGSPNAAILQNMLGADNELRDPQSENEALLKLIYEDVIGAVYDARDEAQAAAEAAGTAAEAVANKAPAITDTASGAVASFPDGADNMPLKSLVIDIDPVQDLHGYDNPWPAGGGVNILDPNLKFAAETYYGGVVLSTTDGYNITFSGTPTESGNIITNSIPTADAIVLPAGTYTSVGAIFATYKADGSWYGNRQIGTWTADEPFIIRQAYIQAVAGNPMTGSRFIALVKGSTAPAAWSPYSNLCPITGWTGANVTGAGKNLLTSDAWSTGLATITVGDDINSISPTDRYNHSFCIPAKDGLVFSIKSTDLAKINYYTVNMYKGGKLYQRYTATIATANVTETYTVPVNWAVDYVRINLGAPSGVVCDPTKAEVQAIKGTTAEDYVAPVGTTKSISFPSTIYGGTDEVVSGSGKKTQNYIEFDGSNDENWSWNSINSLFKISVPGGVITNAKTQYGNYTKNNIFKSTSWANRAQTDGTVGMFYGESAIFVKYSGITSVNEIREFLASNPLQVVYTLATPSDFSTTPITVESLLGQNNIFADCGPVDVEYRADIGLYIDKLTGSTEDDMVANANIPNNTYFLVGNTLYKSTAAIAAGATIVPGTNCTKTDLAAALNALQ